MSEKYCDLAIPPRGVPTRAEYEEVKARIDNIINTVYPVGSYYWSDRDTSPADLWHVGTWERVKDRFVLAAGDSYAAGATGGEAQHTLTEAEMPRHYHDSMHWESPDGAPFGVNLYDNFDNKKGEWKFEYTNTASQARFYTGYAGGSQPHNNMPPYITAYCWHRTA